MAVTSFMREAIADLLVNGVWDAIPGSLILRMDVHQGDYAISDPPGWRAVTDPLSGAVNNNKAIISGTWVNPDSELRHIDGVRLVDTIDQDDILALIDHGEIDVEKFPVEEGVDESRALDIDYIFTFTGDAGIMALCLSRLANALVGGYFSDNGESPHRTVTKIVFNSTSETSNFVKATRKVESGAPIEDKHYADFTADAIVSQDIAVSSVDMQDSVGNNIVSLVVDPAEELIEDQLIEIEITLEIKRPGQQE